MKALVVERKPMRFAAARLAGGWEPGAGARVGPLRLAEVAEPALPGKAWHRVTPLLSGICGSDLATVDGRSSRYFEPIVSFPFVPGHEVVGRLDDGSRVVVQPALHCATRGIDPPCEWCARGVTNRCELVAFGHLEPGLQTGYCSQTGGGWGHALVAHESQIHPAPDDLDDCAAVMVEPAACAVHAARQITAAHVAVIGSGTLGLLTVAAIRHLVDPDRVLIATAKHAGQRRWARALGADVVVAPAELARAVRRATNSRVAGQQLTGGVGAVVDCVGSAQSIQQALSVVGPGGQVHLLGMPARVDVDLTGLWHREISLRGCYAYDRADFEAAFDLVRQVGLGRLVSASYPIDRYTEALDHAAHAGARGAVKIVFDLRSRTTRKARA